MKFEVKKKLTCPTKGQMLTLSGDVLARVTFLKYLGVYIADDLSWTRHIAHVAGQVSKSSGILNTIKSYVPRKVLTSLYFAICQSYMFYCTPIWACGSKASLESIFVGQKRAIHIVTYWH